GWGHPALRKLERPGNHLGRLRIPAPDVAIETSGNNDFALFGECQGHGKSLFGSERRLLFSRGQIEQPKNPRLWLKYYRTALGTLSDLHLRPGEVLSVGTNGHAIRWGPTPELGSDPPRLHVPHTNHASFVHDDEALAIGSKGQTI